MPLSHQSHEFLRIEKYIFRNNPRPGDKVATEDELIEKLGITRYRARQAFDLLVQMGVLERSKRRGTIVKRLATNDMTQNILEQFKLAGFDEVEFKEARLMIESAVMPFVAKRLTPAIQAQMRRLIDSIRSNAEDPLKADLYLMDFHLLMLRSSGNRVMEVFAGIVRTYFGSTKHLVENAPKDFFLKRAEYCEKLLNALAMQDVFKAQAILQEMIASA